MDFAHFYAAALARPAQRPMVEARFPNTGYTYRGCEGVVKFLGPTAVRKVARRGAPQNVWALIALSTTYWIGDNDLYVKLREVRH